MRVSKKILKALSLASTCSLAIPMAAKAQSNQILATYGDWQLTRNPTSYSYFAAPFCSIVNSTDIGQPGILSQRGKQALALAISPSVHKVYMVYAINLPDAPTTPLTVTWAFDNGDIVDSQMTYINQTAFIGELTGVDVRKRFIDDLTNSGSVQITIPNIISAQAYMTDTATALRALVNCFKGLGQ